MFPIGLYGRGGGSLSSSTGNFLEFFEALQNRDQKTINSILKKGTTLLEYTDHVDHTALHMLVKKRCKNIQEEWLVIKYLNRFLRTRKVKINAKCQSGRTALHWAVKNGMNKVVDFFIENGADLNAMDEQGNRVAHYMIEGEFHKYFELTRQINSPEKLQPYYQESVKFFEQMLARNIKIDCANKNHDTPLTAATWRNLLHVIPTLLEYTQDVTFRDKENKNILHHLIENKHSGTFLAVPTSCYDQNMVRDILEKMLIKGFSVNAVDDHGNTPLHYALQKDKTELLELLCKKYERGDICDDKRNNILHLIIENCVDLKDNKHKKDMEKCVRLLLSNGIDFNEKNKKGYKPVRLAVIQVHPTILQILNEFGADLTEKYNGGNLLHLLSKESNMNIDSSKLNEVISLLVNHGCDVDEIDNKGSTPIHLALKKNRLTVVEGLIQHKANVNVRELKARWFTPLHIAVDRNYKSLIPTLNNFGADINARDALGRTPLHLTMKYKFGTIKALLERGADVDIEDCKKLLPIHYAIDNDNVDSIIELIKYGSDFHDDDIYEKVIDKTNTNVMDTVFQYLVKRSAVGLTVPSDFKINSYGESLQKLHKDLVKEVENLKSFKLNDRTSLYDLLHMDQNVRCSFNSNKNFNDLITSEDLEKKFPNYHVMIVALKYQISARQRLLEPAKWAWYDLTKIMLPDICVFRILAHLRNRDLNVMIAGTRRKINKQTCNPLVIS